MVISDRENVDPEVDGIRNCSLSSVRFGCKACSSRACQKTNELLRGLGYLWK